MKKKGAALLVVIIVMMLTFMLAAIMFATSMKHLKVSNNALESTKAYYCAETGIYDAINYVELMAEAGAFNDSYVNNNIPIYNLYSLGENNGANNAYLFGNPSAIYTASMKLNSMVNSSDKYKRIYIFDIKSKGTYNNQNYLINDTVKISYSIDRWTYEFIRKLTTKD